MWIIKVICFLQLHLEPAPAEPKESKEPEVDWFAEHGESAAPTNTSELVPTAQVTLTQPVIYSIVESTAVSIRDIE